MTCHFKVRGIRQGQVLHFTSFWFERLDPDGSENGHYKPTETHNDQFIQEMSDRGINAKQTREYRKKD